MAFVLVFLKGIRNHWKKSTFAAVAITYGYNYTKEYYEIQQLMRAYCEKAVIYGHEPLPVDESPKHITVILNPNANRRKAVTDFEKYCAPILHLAGMYVDIVKTESEGHARTLAENLTTTNAVVVAGGDGTLSEVITGLMRKSNSNKINIPIGVLPLGRSNTMGSSLFPGGDHLKKVRSLADASLAVIEAYTKTMDVMKIEITEDEDVNQGKAVYALSLVEWGAYRDAQSRKDKYWLFGPLRNYATYLFNGFKNSLSWKCQASINYTLPCQGCTNCIKTSEIPNDSTVRWYNSFLPHRKPKPVNDLPKVTNNFCSVVHTKNISTSDFAVCTTNVFSHSDDIPKLKLNLGPDRVDYFTFVSQGWHSENGGIRDILEVVDAKQIEIKPDINYNTERDKWYSIDKEDFEVKPCRITLLPKVVEIFCKRSNMNR